MASADYFEEPRVLVTVDLSKPGWKNLQPFELLSSMEVVLLGLYPITDQVSPEQARDQFGEEAEERMNVLADRFRETGIPVEKCILFGVDLGEAIDRVAESENCTAILTWNESLAFHHIGVFLRAHEARNNILNNVAFLMADQDQQLTLVHFLEDNDDSTDVAEARSILETEREYLIERGLEEEQIEIRIDRVEEIDDAIAETADEFDAVVMGETKPTVGSKIFGTRHELARENASGPIFIVRYPESD